MIKKVITAAIISTMILASSAGACTFTHLPIDPISAEKIDTFRGSSEIIDVSFSNEKTEGKVEVFPDSPLMITNKKTYHICRIDGGVWVRKDVYVSDDNLVVLAHEFSGSNDFLNFYNTRSCKKIGQIDISNSKWNLEKSNIVVIRQSATNGKKSKKRRVYPLSKYCPQAN